MKRLICFFLCLLLVIPVASAEQTEDPFVLHITTSFGEVGEELVVKGVVENAPNCASYRVIFTYDPTLLEPVSARPDAKKGFVIEYRCQTCGQSARCRAALGRGVTDDMEALIALTVNRQ